MRVSLQLNGETFSGDADGDESLLAMLRRHGHTAVKEGCGVGVCGACGVIVGGSYVSSCLYLAGLADGAEVWTAEGLSRTDPETADALAVAEALQCGACSPGQLVACWAYVHLGPGVPDEETIRHFFAGNLCRCTGYSTIVEAVKARCVAEGSRARGSSA